MDFLIQIINFVALPIELLAAVLIFAGKYQRRSHFSLRLLSGIAGIFLLPGLIMLILTLWASNIKMTRSLPVVLIYSTVVYVIGAGFALLCFRTSTLEALYCTTCAYLTQHFAYSLYSLVYPDTGVGRISPASLLYLLIYGGVYWAAWFFFARKLSHEGWYQMDSKRAMGTTVSALGISILLSAVGQQMESIYHPLYALVLIYSMVCCFYILWDQVGQQRQLVLQHELDVQQQLWLQQKAQYEMSAENVELINRKCHDLKHQIAALKRISDQTQRDKSIQELEKSVMIYDSIVETGNDILDTVLTEKSLLCEARGITLTCVADGECLSFMDAVDIYTMFGNALDNAIESVSKLEDPDQRTIAVMVFSRANLVFLQLENYYGEALNYDGSLPATSKKEEQGYHGYGLKSIQYIAEKYGGFLTIQNEDDIFLLRVTIPKYK